MTQILSEFRVQRDFQKYSGFKLKEARAYEADGFMMNNLEMNCTNLASRVVVNNSVIGLAFSTVERGCVRGGKGGGNGG